MRRILLSVPFWIGLCLPALGQVASYVYTALGYQQVTVPTIGTATSLTVPSASRMAQICAESNIIRYRDDGTAPTASVGMPIAAGTCIMYSGPLPSIQFIQATSPAVLDVSYYR